MAFYNQRGTTEKWIKEPCPALLGRENASRFSNTGTSAIIGEDVGSYLGNVSWIVTSEEGPGMYAFSIRLDYLSAIAGILALVLLCSWPVSAQEMVTSATPGTIANLKREAANDRAQAERQKRQAAELRQLADQSRRSAAESTVPAYRESWLGDAQRREADAAALERDAADLEARAMEKEARAARLQAAYDARLDQQPPSSPATAASTDAGASGNGDAFLRQQRQELERIANLQERLAGEWRDAGVKQLDAVETTSSESVRAALRETAALHLAQARQLQADAEDGRQSAQGLAEELAAPESEPLEDTQPSSDFAGRWHLEDDPDYEIRIEEPDPDSRDNRASLKSRNHVYLGQSENTDDPKRRRLTLAKKPLWKEMNLAIPDWARSQVESELEWRLEVEGEDKAECGPETIALKWYPGEVSWDPVVKHAWVSGEGDPVRLIYERAVEDPVESTGNAVIFLEDANQAGGEDRIIDEVARGMPFRVTAILPSKLAKEAGRKIEVLVSDRNGQSYTLSLVREPTPDASWTYRSENWVTFQPESGWDEVIFERLLEQLIRSPNPTHSPPGFGGFRRAEPFETIALDIPNGEIATFTFGEASSSVVVFGGPIDQAIQRVRSELNDREIIYRTRLFLGVDDAAEAARLERRLKQILNARILMNHQPSFTETWPPHMPLEIGLRYLWLLGLSDEQHRDRSPAADGPDARGVVYQSALEQNAVQATIEKVELTSTAAYLSDLTGRLKQRIDTSKVATQMIGYDVNDILIAFTGKDWYGRQVEENRHWYYDERTLAAIRLPLTIFADVGGLYGFSKAARVAGNSAGTLNPRSIPAASARGSGELSRGLLTEGMKRAREQAARPIPRGAVSRELSLAELRTYYNLPAGTGIAVRAEAAAVRHGREFCILRGCGPAVLGYFLEAKGIWKVSQRRLLHFMHDKLGLAIRNASWDDLMETLKWFGVKTEIAEFSWKEIADGTAEGAVYFVRIFPDLGRKIDAHHVVITGVKSYRGAGKLLENNGGVYAAEFFDLNASGIVTIARKALYVLTFRKDSKYSKPSSSNECIMAIKAVVE